eukprot:COSAG01_NODE_22526_length_851_cov_9.598404_1_plen_127_part_00
MKMCYPPIPHISVCETTVTIMKQAALAPGLTMQERMDLLTSGECVGIPNNGYLRAKRFLVMATIAQLNSELCIEEIPMQCQPGLGSFKCIEHFYGSANTTPHGMLFRTPHPTHHFVRNHTPRGAAL